MLVLLWWCHICYSWRNEWRDISHLLETEPHKYMLWAQRWYLPLLTFYSFCRWSSNTIKAAWLSFEFRYLTFFYADFYFSPNLTVNDDLVLKTMGISLNKSERWLLTDTVQMENIAVFARWGLYSCWMYFLPGVQTLFTYGWVKPLIWWPLWYWMQWWLHSSAD